LPDRRLCSRAEPINRRRLLQVLGASAATCSCATARDAAGLAEQSGPPEAPITLAMRVDYGRRMTTRGRLNGAGPYDFVIDTAASVTAIFQNLADRAAIEPSGGPDMSVLGLSGARKLPAFHIGDLTFGDLALANQMSPILPDWRDLQRTPQGIVGIDLFDDTITVFDPWNDRFDVWRAGSAEAQSVVVDWPKARLRTTDFGGAIDGLFLLDVTLNDRVFPFLFDTGSSVTVCNFEAAQALRVVPHSPRKTRRADVSDVHGEVVETHLLFVPRVRIGSAELSDRSLYVSNAPFFDHIGYHDRPFGILGLDFLRAQRFAVDFRRNVLFLDVR